MHPARQNAVTHQYPRLAGKPIDVLLNVAGVMSAKEADTLTTVNKDTLTRTFETNTFGPLLLTQALLENLIAAENAKIGIVSSRVGSMGDNSTGGSYAYRASKAAVNSVGKSMACDLQSQGIVVTLLHPGIVRSGLDPDPAAGTHPETVEPEVAAGKLVCTEDSLLSCLNLWLTCMTVGGISKQEY